MDITIVVPRMDRKGTKDWKAPFKKLKLSKILAEDEWTILLHVHGKDVKRVHKLTEGLKVETVMEHVADVKDGKQKTWDDVKL